MNLENIQNAVAKFSFTAKIENELITIRNKKGQIAAKLVDGKVVQVKQGNQNLCGALVRDAINAVI